MRTIIRKLDSDLEYCAEYDCGLDLKDIVNVLAQVPGEADQLDWHWIVEMKDGRFLYVTGGCDYSGWGCQDWGEAKEAKTAIEAAMLAPEKEEYHEEYNIRQQLLDQLAGEQPYGLRLES